MIQKLNKKLRNRKGFTLIELIVVLAILGIILAIAVPNYLGVQNTAQQSADVDQLELIEKGVTLWKSLEGGATGTYYLNADGTTATLYSDAALSADAIVVSSYLEPVPAPASTHYTNLAADNIVLTVGADSVTAQYCKTDGSSLARP